MMATVQWRPLGESYASPIKYSCGGCGKRMLIGSISRTISVGDMPQQIVCEKCFQNHNSYVSS